MQNVEDARNYANGTAHFTGYNTLGRAEAVEFTRSGSAFAAYQYKHDALGQRRAAVETVTDSGQVYQLDSLYRVTSEGRGISAFDFGGLDDFNINNASVQDLIAADNSDQYQLDAAGNAVSMTRDGVNTAREVTSTGEYTRIGDQARAVDFEGNLLADGRFAYEYDGLNRLVEVRDAQGGKYRWGSRAAQVTAIPAYYPRRHLRRLPSPLEDT